MWTTFGHQQVKKILDLQLNSRGLPHAYLFQGPEGVGKKTLALEFAGKVLNSESLATHPDFQILDAAGEIVIEQILDFIGKIRFKPFFGAKKIAIINNAENLNPQSGSALLKTLEEPSESSIIILIAGSGKLLPTIRSRCQTLNFSAFGKNELAEFARNFNLKVSEEMISLSFGRTGRLKDLSENRDFFEREQGIVRQYQKLSAQTLGEKLAAIGELAEMEQEKLERNFLTWLMWQAQSLSSRPAEFFKARALTDAWLGLKKNLNKKLVLQKLFMTL